MLPEQYAQRRGSRNPLTGAAVGALGGLLGAWVMVRINHRIGGLESPAHADDPHRVAAAPNDTDGTISDEPASRKAASQLTEAIAGRPLGERGKQIGGPAVHYAFGALMGAFYGAVAEMQPSATAAAGLPYGAAVWLIADEIGLPVTGLSRPPHEYPLARHAAALTSHLGFGLTVETVRRLLLGRSYEHEVTGG